MNTNPISAKEASFSSTQHPVFHPLNKNSSKHASSSVKVALFSSIQHIHSKNC